MSTYLSVRKRVAGGVSFYAVTNYWNSVKKVQEKKQVYIGAISKKGASFNQRAMEYAPLFRNTEYDSLYWEWRNSRSVLQNSDFLVPLKQVEKENSIHVGISLLLNKVTKELRLDHYLAESFGVPLTEKILALAYYCACHVRNPLFECIFWSEDQRLPGGSPLTGEIINKTLQSISPNAIQTFLKSWSESQTKTDLLSIETHPVNSVHRNNEEIALGMFHDLNSLIPPRILVTMKRVSQIPIRYQIIPTEEPDFTTINNIVNILQEQGLTPPKIVLGRSFASWDNIRYLLRNKIKFTMGVSLDIFPAYQAEIDSLKNTNGFAKPESTVELYNRDEILKTQTVTRVHQLEGQTVYLHYYYVDEYRRRAMAQLKDRLERVKMRLEKGYPLLGPAEQKLSDNYFTVRITSNNERIVKLKTAAIDGAFKSAAGYFAVMSNQLKKPDDALKAYKIREGFEDRMDDLKNEEDFYRFKVYSFDIERSRIFIQFISQVLRLFILHRLHNWKNKPEKIHSLTELLWIISSLRKIDIKGHEPFFEEPNETQKAILEEFGISLPNEKKDMENEKTGLESPTSKPVLN